MSGYDTVRNTVILPTKSTCLAPSLPPVDLLFAVRLTSHSLPLNDVRNVDEPLNFPGALTAPPLVWSNTQYERLLSTAQCACSIKIREFVSLPCCLAVLHLKSSSSQVILPHSYVVCLLCPRQQHEPAR